MVVGTMASSDFSPGVRLDFALRLIPAVTMDVSHRPDETSPVSSSAVATSRSPYAGGFLAAALQALRRVRGLRLA